MDFVLNSDQQGNNRINTINRRVVLRDLYLYGVLISGSWIGGGSLYTLSADYTCISMVYLHVNDVPIIYTICEHTRECLYPPLWI